MRKSKSEQQEWCGISLTVNDNNVNLETHPQCPKYLSFSVVAFHIPIENRGIFRVKAAELLQWLVERDRHGDFETTFRKWLDDADFSNEKTYGLSDNTVFKLNLEFFIDDALEHDHSIKTYCPACETERTNDDIKLVQESSGGWIYRLVDCKCGSRLASYEVMHFILKEGSELPKSSIRVVKDFK